MLRFLHKPVISDNIKKPISLVKFRFHMTIPAAFQPSTLQKKYVSLPKAVPSATGTSQTPLGSFRV